MKDKKSRTENLVREATAQCTCTHPTHFLGRCKKEVNPPEHKCAECMQDHSLPLAEPI